MSAAGESTGPAHSIQKCLLVLTRVFAGQFHLYVYGASIRNPVPRDVGFALVPHVHKGAVFRIKLSHRVIPGDAAMLTEGGYNLVLKCGLTIYRFLPLITCRAQ